MTHALVHKPLPEEIELAALLVDIEHRREMLAHHTSERSELELAMSQFAADVKTRVGDMKEEIRTIRAKLEEMRQLTWRLKSDPDAVPEKLEQQVADEFADEEPDPSEFVSDGRNRPPGNSYLRKKSVNEETASEVLRLYRTLAKRYHPDLARTPAERRRRTEIMFRINVAFRDNDLATLQSLDLEVDLGEPVSHEEMCRRRLSWAKHEIEQVDRDIERVLQRVESLLTSETYKLWQSSQESDSVLDDLERRTRERLQRERERLKEANAQYARVSVRRKVMQRRAARREEAAAAAGSD